MFDPAVWTEHGSQSPRFGLIVTKNGATALIWRRCYRIRWRGDWTK